MLTATMVTRRSRAILLPAVVALPLLLLAEEKVNLSIVNRIRSEAFERSHVMDYMFYLTDVHGPRLTGSPGYMAAANWVVQKAKELGLENAKLEKWGPFGRTWTYTRFSAHLLEPQYQPMIGFPLAWSQPTNGPVTGEPMMAVLREEGDFAKFTGKLKGKIVMLEAQRATPLQTEAMARRYSQEELVGLEQAPEPGASPFAFGGPPRQQGGPAGPGGPGNFAQARRFRTKVNEFLREEGVALILSSGIRGDGGTVFATSAGSRDLKEKVPPTTVVLTPEHYNRIARLLDKKIPVKVEIEVQAKITEEDQESVNVVAEIPGGKKADEVVMIGGHLDSWHAGTGATDNAAGSAVAIEVMRILKSMNVKMDRTVRLGLWSGEEQGLLGSRAYVKEHFADPTKMVPTVQHAKLAGYFNLDNGTGKIRGVYLQGNDMMRPIFEAWFAPFKDLGAATISIRNTGGTDHLSFDAVGLPGFQFIQEPMEYTTRTHHSNMDVYDHISKGDLMQAAAVMASFVYNTATREEMLPRKPLPKPQPERRFGEGPPTGSAQ